MKALSNKIKIVAAIFMVITILINIPACEKDDLMHANNNIQLPPMLSDIGIFQGQLSDLIPANGFQLYEISTPLFSDYAEKQRLIKIPNGTKIIAVNDGLPDFPDGTLLIKTFYYFNDKRDTSKGKRIIETRVLIKAGTTWNVGTYLWNEEQTDAKLLTTGLNEMVNWINEDGEAKAFSVLIPSNNECATCHNSNGEVLPIGVKIRNLNFNVVRNNNTINQLSYFENIGLLQPVNPSSFSSLPNAWDSSLALEQRARAYLDVNCAHCHNPNGYAAHTHIFFSYEIPFEDTKIGEIKNAIPDVMSSGKMPKLGTTTVDEKGLQLIKQYVQSL